MPHGWAHPGTLWTLARRNVPVAAADAVEWGSRRIDIAVLGLFFRPRSSAFIMWRKRRVPASR
jgi:hypothetical protein